MKLQKFRGKIRPLVSNLLDIFEFNTKRRITKALFGKYAISILYSGRTRKFSWKINKTLKPVIFELSTEDDYFSLFANGTETLWESESLENWAKIAQTSDIVIDVGAYFGLFSNVAAITEGPNLIIAIEPNEVTYSKLVKHISLNNTSQRVKPLNLAISNNDGTETLMIPKGRRTSSGAQLQNSSLGNMNGNWEVANTVRTVKLDSLLDLNEKSRVSQMKIDTEGYEYNVLLGAHEILSASQPHLFIEILTLEVFIKCNNLLKAYGYKDPTPLDGSSLTIQSDNAVSDNDLARNYLFSPREKI